MRTTTRTIMMTSTWGLFATRKFLCAFALHYSDLLRTSDPRSDSFSCHSRRIHCGLKTDRPRRGGCPTAWPRRAPSIQACIDGFAGHIPEGRLNALQNDPRVEFIEQDIEMHASARLFPQASAASGRTSRPPPELTASTSG